MLELLAANRDGRRRANERACNDSAGALRRGLIRGSLGGAGINAKIYKLPARSANENRWDRVSWLPCSGGSGLVAARWHDGEREAMGRFGLIGAGLASASAFGQVATFTPLRGGPPVFAVVGSTWKGTGLYPSMSGDGSTVTDGRWRWTSAGGVVPAGFVPGSNQSSDVVRRPLGLSFDGQTEFGAIFDSSVGQSNSMYWESSGRFDVVPISRYNYNWFFWQSQTLSDDGQWICYSQNATPVVRLRMKRGGMPETLNRTVSGNGIWSPTRGGDAFLVDGGVMRIPPAGALSDAVFQIAPAFSLNPIVLSSDGRFAAGFGFPSNIGAVWNTETGAIDRFTPPLGFNAVSGDMFISDSGAVVLGRAGAGVPAINRVFVRRRGEQARELRVVLDRFGDAISNYYVLELAGGLSRDGQTILVLYSSPLWYGDGAAIVTLPDWAPCPADLNFDGFVDDADFSIFAKAYDRLTTTDGDLNVDQFTDDADFSVFAVAYDILVCP